MSEYGFLKNKGKYSPSISIIARHHHPEIVVFVSTRRRCFDVWKEEEQKWDVSENTASNTQPHWPPRTDLIDDHRWIVDTPFPGPCEFDGDYS